ncbi:MAG TPA: RNA methyltransferase [Chitinophagaceae bacterium]|nr:RNA methyltransferase [Chitinophagaceae bacterium]
MPGKQKAKYIQSLGQKKYRDAEGLFIAEGPKLVAELLQSAPQYVKEVYAVKEWLKENTGNSPTQKFFEVSDRELEKLSQLKTPHQVVAVVQKFEEEKSVDVKGKVSLVLDTIQDPGNLGTIIRIADWFGVSQVICSHDCADIYNPKVVQATMGSIARVKVFYTDLASWLKEQRDIRIYATVMEGKDVTNMNALNEGLIIIGNESKGIHEEILELVNEKITIPRKGKAESLNVAVAAGIVLSHLV